jgi:hypothetical protein
VRVLYLCCGFGSIHQVPKKAYKGTKPLETEVGNLHDTLF